MSKLSLDKKKKISFVASGGAVKAASYHIGVSIAMQEYGFSLPNQDSDKNKVKIIIGSSAGSVYGALISNFELSDIIKNYKGDSEKEVFRRVTYQDIFKPSNAKTYLNQVGQLSKLSFTLLKYFSQGLEVGIDKAINLNGLFSTKGLESYFREILPINDFKQLKKEKGIELYIIGSELDSPRKAIFGHRSTKRTNNPYQDYYTNQATISQAIACSTAVPCLFEPYVLEIQGKKIRFNDGEVKRVLSTHVGEDLGADLSVISHTYTPFIKEQGKKVVNEPKELDGMLEGLSLIIKQVMNIVFYEKIKSSEKKFKQKKALEELLKKRGINSDLKKEILATQFHKEGRDRLYIASDNEVFYYPYFNISPKVMTGLVKLGYLSAKKAFEKQGLTQQQKVLEKYLL